MLLFSELVKNNFLYNFSEMRYPDSCIEETGFCVYYPWIVSQSVQLASGENLYLTERNYLFFFFGSFVILFCN